MGLIALVQSDCMRRPVSCGITRPVRNGRIGTRHTSMRLEWAHGTCVLEQRDTQNTRQMVAWNGAGGNWLWLPGMLLFVKMGVGPNMVVAVCLDVPANTEVGKCKNGALARVRKSESRVSRLNNDGRTIYNVREDTALKMTGKSGNDHVSRLNNDGRKIPTVREDTALKMRGKSGNDYAVVDTSIKMASSQCLYRS